MLSSRLAIRQRLILVKRLGEHCVCGIVDRADKILATTLTSGTWGKINKVQRGIEQNVARIHPNTQNIQNIQNTPNVTEYTEHTEF